tara:strand:- start:1577 stop:2224 length:648 start_codon:yes stop_codon:yes gene_type:complete
MVENSFQTQYDVTKKARIKRFYDENKTLIYSFVIILILILGSTSYYLDSKERKKIQLSENYLQAKVYLEKNEKDKAKNLLKEIVFANDSTYSTLSFFLLMNQKLINDNYELLNLFEHLLSKNKYPEEIKNLLIYKKALFSADFIDEAALLKSTKPLLNDDNIWKSHGLLLLADYFKSKGEYNKAIEFYQKIFTINNLHQDLYNHARSQLAIISNE